MEIFLMVGSYCSLYIHGDIYHTYTQHCSLYIHGDIYHNYTQHCWGKKGPHDLVEQSCKANQAICKTAPNIMNGWWRHTFVYVYRQNARCIRSKSRCAWAEWRFIFYCWYVGTYGLICKCIMYCIIWWVLYIHCMYTPVLSSTLFKHMKYACVNTLMLPARRECKLLH